LRKNGGNDASISRHCKPGSYPAFTFGRGEKRMIVDYDKELSMTYISKQINGRWIQLGLTEDEVKQITDKLVSTTLHKRDVLSEKIASETELINRAFEAFECGDKKEGEHILRTGLSTLR